MKNKRIIKALKSVTSKDRGFKFENIMVEHDGIVSSTMTSTNGVLLLSAEFHDTTEKKPLKGFLNDENGNILASELDHVEWRTVVDKTKEPDFTVSLDQLEKMVKAIKVACGERKRHDLIGVEFSSKSKWSPIQIRVASDSILKVRDGSDVMVTNIKGVVMPMRG